MIHRKINLWPALPVCVLLAALLASRLMADPAPAGSEPPAAPGNAANAACLDDSNSKMDILPGIL